MNVKAGSMKIGPAFFIAEYLKKNRHLRGKAHDT